MMQTNEPKCLTIKFYCKTFYQIENKVIFMDKLELQ